MVCSKEIVEKQSFNESMVDRKNFVLIPDPRNTKYLANRIEDMLSDKQLTYIIGKHGQMLSQFNESEYVGSNPLVYLVSRFS